MAIVSLVAGVAACGGRDWWVRVRARLDDNGFQAGDLDHLVKKLKFHVWLAPIFFDITLPCSPSLSLYLSPRVPDLVSGIVLSLHVACAYRAIDSCWFGVKQQFPLSTPTPNRTYVYVCVCAPSYTDKLCVRIQHDNSECERVSVSLLKT